MEIAPDGRIVVTGQAFTTWAANRFIALRLGADGTRDLAFNDGTGHYYDPAVFEGTDILFDPDGSFMVCASVADGSFFPSAGLLRFTPDGVLDASFGVDGVAACPITVNGNVFPEVMRRMWDGRVMVIGDRYSDFFFSMFWPNGAVDTTFADQGRLLCPFNNALGWVQMHELEDVAITPTGRTFLAGNFDAGPAYGYVAALDGLIASVPEHEDHAFAVIPSLASDMITITTEGRRIPGYEVVDIQGQVRMRSDAPAGTTTLGLAVHALAPGVYLVRLPGFPPGSAKRFVVMR